MLLRACLDDFPVHILRAFAMHEVRRMGWRIVNVSSMVPRSDRLLGEDQLAVPMVQLGWHLPMSFCHAD